MTEIIKQTLRDSKKARWIALVILSFTMFAGYLFTEIISPLKPILEQAYGWNSTDFGTVTSFYGFFNVWFFMLLIVGVLLDKFGIRFSTLGSVFIMIAGGTIKYFAFKLDFDPNSTVNFLFLFEMKTQIFWASMGYALFGIGVEYAGITVSKSIVKWFKGKEMALAMGMQVAIARMGSAIPLFFGAYIAKTFDVPTVILGAVVMLGVGFIAFFYYNTLDKKLDNQLGEEINGDDDDGFKLSDLAVIFTNRGFWLIAILCVLFYSAVFPFYKYGPDLMVNKFGVSESWAGVLPALVPFGTMLLTPFFGGLYDKKGKGATIMIIGAVLLILVHIIFYLPFIDNVVFAFFNVLILGVAFSLVPSAMWPSVPKIIPEKQLGSAYAAIFWVQNLGLWGIPLLVGIVLNSTNPTISPNKAIVQDSFVKAYNEVVSNSQLKNATSINGDMITNDNIIIYARATANNIISNIVMNKDTTIINEKEIVIKTDTAKLRTDIYLESKKIIESYVLDSLDLATINTIEEKENIAFKSMNEHLVAQVSKIIKSKKVKLNYNYQTTWLIFVVLTFVALLVAFLLKIEDKRKGYGLELPNIKEDDNIK